MWGWKWDSFLGDELIIIKNEQMRTSVFCHCFLGHGCGPVVSVCNCVRCPTKTTADCSSLCKRRFPLASLCSALSFYIIIPGDKTFIYKPTKDRVKMRGADSREPEASKLPLLSKPESFPVGEEAEEEQGLGRRVLIESKKLWHIVGPAIFSRLASYSMLVITQAFAGHLGDLELAAISISMNVIVGFDFGLLVRMHTHDDKLVLFECEPVIH